jgi:hypothetical protein
MNKKTNKHAQQRSIQRYNVELTKFDLDVMALRIRNNKTLPVSSASKRSIHYVEHNNKFFKVVYSKTTKQIVTYLPFDVDEFNTLAELYKNKLHRKIKKESPFVIRFMYKLLNKIEGIFS